MSVIFSCLLNPTRPVTTPVAMSMVSTSAAAFAALLQAECNVTAWSLQAAALDEDARAQLVSQAFGRTEEQQEELLALKRLFGALPQDVVDFCEGANEVVAAMTASQVACAAECRLTGKESPRSRQKTLAQWLQRQLRTGGELPAATATLLAYCSIAKDAHDRTNLFRLAPCLPPSPTYHRTKTPHQERSLEPPAVKP